MKELSGSDRDILYFDHGGVYSTVYVCQVIKLYTLNCWILLCINYTSLKLTKKINKNPSNNSHCPQSKWLQANRLSVIWSHSHLGPCPFHSPSPSLLQLQQPRGQEAFCRHSSHMHSCGLARTSAFCGYMSLSQRSLLSQGIFFEWACFLICKGRSWVKGSLCELSSVTFYHSDIWLLGYKTPHRGQ